MVNVRREADTEHKRSFPSLYMFSISFVSKCLGKMLQAVFKRAPRAGDVKALEAASCLAEDVARIKPEVGIVDDDIIEFFIRQAVSRKVKPEQIGAFRLDELDFWAYALQRTSSFSGNFAFDVGEKLLEPFCPCS